MKKISILALALVLTLALFTGCRSTENPMDNTSEDTRPTATQPVTVPTTEATVPTTEAPSDVTTTPTDGMMSPSDGIDGNSGNGNPSTGDSGLARGIGRGRK